MRTLLLAALTVATACAHTMVQSAVLLDISSRQVHAELQLPLERMTIAYGQPITTQSLGPNQVPLTAYILSRFHAQTPGGHPFPTQLVAPLSIEQVDGAPYLIARVLFTPPAPAPMDAFDIQDDVLLDRIPNQVALISIRSDWSSSVFADDPQLIGVLRGSIRSVTVDRTGGSWFHGFSSIFRLGIRHIAEGTDHLLFLLTLLLPAPLLVICRRWARFAGVRRSLLQILKVVTAFTVGHSITLALSALGLIHVPSRPIELLIAVSILVSAVHAFHPIFPGRETFIAAFFGLIHGLAFAATLGGLGLGRWERVAGIFAFNLGIETMQVIVVIATMPSLVLLSRTRAYPPLRIGGALFAGVAAVAWIAERLLNLHTPIDLVMDAIAHQALWIAAVLFLISLALLFARNLGSPRWEDEVSAWKRDLT